MRTKAYSDVLARTASLAGLKASDVQPDEAAILNAGLDRALRHAWEFAAWPEVVEVEEFRYRADYNAGTTYATGDQVWSPAENAYFEAVQASTGQAVTNTAYWAPLAGTQWAIYVPWGGDFVPEGATVLRVTEHDPRVTRRPVIVEHELRREGVFPVRDVPDSLWIEYRRPCPELSGSTYDAAATYGAGQQVYYTQTAAPATGDYWQASAAIAAGESPEAAPAKWSRLEIPWRLAEYLAAMAASDWQGANGQTSKALALATAAEDRLYEELLKHELQARQRRQVNG